MSRGTFYYIKERREFTEQRNSTLFKHSLQLEFKLIARASSDLAIKPYMNLHAGMSSSKIYNIHIRRKFRVSLNEFNIRNIIGIYILITEKNLYLKQLVQNIYKIR